jgi:hypothetical protein
MMMVMLHRVNKIIVLLIILNFISCNNEQKELKEKRNEAINKSISIIGYDSYYDVYNKANDSIIVWVENQLASYLGKRLNDCQLDSLICFNNNADKCVMAILTRATFFNDAVIDNINIFNGVRIKTSWYFFSGGTLVLPREYYQEDIHTPLSFEKLKELAMKNIFGTYLKNGKNGELEINDKFFSDLTSGAWCTDCETQEEWDSVYLSVIRKNWEKRDNTVYYPNE